MREAGVGVGVGVGVGAMVAEEVVVVVVVRVVSGAMSRGGRWAVEKSQGAVSG